MRNEIPSWAIGLPPREKNIVYELERAQAALGHEVCALTDLEKARLVDMGIRGPIHVLWDGVNPRSLPDPSVFARKWGIGTKHRLSCA